MSPRACSGALARCTGMARRRGQRTLRGNINVYRARARATFRRTRTRAGLRALQVLRCSAPQREGASCRQRPPSQRSLHNAPIFRLLLKVAVNGTHQCGFFNFCGALWAPTPLLAGARVRRGRRACARIRALPAPPHLLACIVAHTARALHNESSAVAPCSVSLRKGQ